MKRLSNPISAQIELTERCNLKCQHCYNYFRYGSIVSHGPLTAQDFSAIIEKLHSVGVNNVTLTGGEPFLRKDVLFTAIMKAKSFGMEVGINSNAILITSDDAKKMWDMGVDHILISLLGTEPVHDRIAGISGSFAGTCRGISRLVDHGLGVAINMVVSTLNNHDVYNVGAIASRLGARTFCATPIVPSDPTHLPFLLSPEDLKQSLRDLMRAGRDFHFSIEILEPIARCLFTKEEEDEFLPFLGGRYCTAGVSTCAISSLGDVRPCTFSNEKAGNILRENLGGIWQRMEQWSCASMLPPECQQCNANIICEGGCRISAKLTTGSLTGKDLYYSGPIQDFGRIAKSKAMDPIQLPDDLSGCNGRFVPSFRLRKEVNHYGIAYTGNQIMVLQESGYHCLSYLQSLPHFTIKDILAYGLPDSEALSLVQILFRANMIKLMPNKNGHKEVSQNVSAVVLR